MKRFFVITLMLLAGIADAQIFGFTPQQIQFMDQRYWRTTNAFDAGLTTSTVFGASGNVSGFYDTLTYTETDPIFGPWLTSFSATNTPGLTTDNTTTTNDGTRISVKNYDANAMARTVYLRNNRDTLWDYRSGHINAATLGEMTNGGPMAQTLAQLVGP